MRLAIMWDLGLDSTQDTWMSHLSISETQFERARKIQRLLLEALKVPSIRYEETHKALDFVLSGCATM
jgi:hypothetical protein